MQTANESHPDSHRVDSYSNDSDRDLYTIPSYSSWFSWDEIHQNEKIAHSDYFNSTSISKTPKIYKEYRDFIINKFREDPIRRLTFTEVRKCLIGDVGSIHKIFRFLKNWGLINFGVRPSDVYCGGAAENLGRFDSGARSSDSDCNRGDEDEVRLGRLKVVVEEGAPSGIRVAEFPNSTKVLAAAPGEAAVGSGCEEVGEDGFRLPPLTSYSDAFGEAGRKKGCWNCGAVCVSGYYESVKQGGSVICAKCFKNENYEESKLADDFKLIDVDGTGNFGTDVWTDSETMLLLEAVTKYGADWNLAERHVRTKTKLDCISRLIQLPFGEHLLNASVIKGVDRSSSYHASDVKQMGTTSATEPQEEPSITEDQHHECMMSADVAAGQVEDGDGSGRPFKRRCITSSGDAGSSLMKQVARLSTIVGPHVAAAAAKAAVASLCNENPCAIKFYEAEEDDTSHDLGFPTLNNETTRVIEGADTDMVKHKQSDSLEATPEKSGPSTLQIRVAIATALGAAAAHAKLLADQEEREMEHLMAIIIEAQLRKIECKVKHFEELELIMEKEYSQVQQLKDSNLSDQIEVLQHALNAGISRWKDDSSKLSTNHLL